MRPIEFHDSFSRSQNVDKLQSRDIHKPADDVALATQKQAVVDEEKKTQIQNTEETKDKLVNKDKEDREKQQHGGKKKKENKDECSLENKRTRRGGFFLVDIDA
jgi:hypothetical protein